MAWLLLVVASLCWLSFDVCRKRLARDNPAFFISWLFSLFTLPGYLVFFYFTTTMDDINVDMDYAMMATVSGIMASIGGVFFIRALTHGKLSLLIPVLALTPVIAAVINRVLFGINLPSLAYLLIALCCFATYRLLGDEFRLKAKGAVSMLIAAFSWGACICVDQFALQAVPIAFHALWVNVVVIFVLSTGLWMAKVPFKFNGNSVWWLLGAVSFSCAVLMQFSALQHIDASIVELVKRATGVLGALMIGRIMFSEEVTMSQYFHSSIIVIAVSCLAVMS